MLAARSNSFSSTTRIASANSFHSHGESFHTAVDSPEELSSQEQQPRKSKPRSQRRKDSGYSEDFVKPIRIDHSIHGQLDLVRLQGELNSLAQKLESAGRTSRRHSKKTNDKGTYDNDHTSQQSKANSVKPRKPSLRNYSSGITSPSSSLYGRPKGPSRAASIHSPIAAEELYLVHQKAREIFQAPELPENAVSSTETTKAPSYRGTRSVEQLSSDDSSHRSSATGSMAAIDMNPEIQMSPLYTATNIDWTHPTTRQQAYERHDRGRRGVRGFFRRLTPRRWQTEQLDFYDDNNHDDAGSVRRYRLDLDDAEEDFRVLKEAPSRPQLQRMRHTFTCLPLSRKSSTLT